MLFASWIQSATVGDASLVLFSKVEVPQWLLWVVNISLGESLFVEVLSLGTGAACVEMSSIATTIALVKIILTKLNQL